MSPTTIIAVDPGGAACGLVKLTTTASDALRPAYVDHRLIERADGEPIESVARRCCKAVGELVGDPETAGDWFVACEALNEPNPRLGIIRTRGLLDTSHVIGALAVLFHPQMVRPYKHGGMYAEWYPDELIGPREDRRKLTGKLRHCRSAYDVGCAAAAIRSLNDRTPAEAGQ